MHGILPHLKWRISKRVKESGNLIRPQFIISTNYPNQQPLHFSIRFPHISSNLHNRCRDPLILPDVKGIHRSFFPKRVIRGPRNKNRASREPRALRRWMRARESGHSRDGEAREGDFMTGFPLIISSSLGRPRAWVLFKVRPIRNAGSIRSRWMQHRRAPCAARRACVCHCVELNVRPARDESFLCIWHTPVDRSRNTWRAAWISGWEFRRNF